MKFVLLAVLIFAVIGFFVVVWKAARDWRWYQIVAAVFTMLLAVTFMFPVAGVLKSRAAWHQVYEEQVVWVERVEDEQQVIKHGDPADPTVGEGVISLAQKLSKLGVEAGRRWRSLRLQTADANSITLVQSAADAGILPGADPMGADPAAAADAAAPAAAPVPLVPDGLVVYGYAEQPQPNAQFTIPMFYLGEFRVTASAPNQVTISPTGPLEAAQEQAIASRQASLWSLYEMLPLDGHEPFIADGSEPDNQNVFGRVDDELVRRLLGNRVSEDTLNDYLRDGSRATPNDRPESRWVKVEFTKSYTDEVDSPDQRGALDGGFFDGNGRAVDSRLQRGGEDQGKVTFKTGTQIVVKEEAANQLFDDGVARLVDTYFVRPLNDYRFVLRRNRLRLTELAIRQEELKFEAQVLQDAIDATVTMLTTNQDIKVKLELDLTQTQVEKRAITEYHDKLEKELTATRQLLLRLYESNQTLERQLDQIHRQVVGRMEALTSAQ